MYRDNFCSLLLKCIMTVYSIVSMGSIITHVSMCKDTDINSYRIRQNFRVGKLSRLCTKHTIHWKTFVVHQAHAIMYCTQQMIQGKNFHDWLKNHESFPTRKFCPICRIRYAHRYNTCTHTCIQTYAYTEDTDQEFFQKTYSVGQLSLLRTEAGDRT